MIKVNVEVSQTYTTNRGFMEYYSRYKNFAQHQSYTLCYKLFVLITFSFIFFILE